MPEQRPHQPNTTMDDRTYHVPRHVGPNIFPAHPFFNRLVRFAHAEPPRICVRDDNTGVEATHVQLLTDVLAYRARVWDALSSKVRQQLDNREEVYIAILAAGGYEFTVATLAALALGAAIVPMTVALPAEEALYFATKSKAVAVLCSEAALELGTSLERMLRERESNSEFFCSAVAPSLGNEPLAPSDIKTVSYTHLTLPTKRIV